jgi:hypothetical protein
MMPSLDIELMWIGQDGIADSCFIDVAALYYGLYLFVNNKSPSPHCLVVCTNKWYSDIYLGPKLAILIEHLQHSNTNKMTVFASVGICLIILYFTPEKQSVQWVFTTFTDGSGWGSRIFSFLLGFLSVAWTMTDYDGTTQYVFPLPV